MFMQAYTYDDILLLPNKSLHSRQDPKLETKLSRNIHIDIPITSANMDTITGFELAKTMSKMGGVGFLHRNMEIDENVEIVKRCLNDWEPYWSPVVPTVGVSSLQEMERAESIIELGVPAICIDIANAYSDRVVNMINFIRSKNAHIDIIVGNVATAPAALFLAKHGVDAIKVGIGQEASVQREE